MPTAEHARLLRAILTLEEEPLPDGQQRKKLRGFDPPLYELRIPPWRILYRIGTEQVRVLDVVARKDLERWVREHR